MNSEIQYHDVEERYGGSSMRPYILSMNMVPATR